MRKLPRIVWGALAALMVALLFPVAAQAAEPFPLHLTVEDGEPIFVQDGGRNVFRDDLTVESGQVIDGDVFVYSGNVEVEDGGQITGDLTVFSGNIEIGEGASVEGDLLNYSGNVSVEGYIGGDLAAMNGNVDLADTARVDGDISVVSGRISREDGASVGGNVVQGPSFRFPGSIMPGAPDAPARPDRPGISLSTNSPSLFGRIGNFIARVFVAALMTAFVILLVGGLFYLRPQWIADTRRNLNEQLALSAVVGALANLVVMFLAMLLAITICLLPLALVPMLLLLAVNLLGWAVASQIVGERLVATTKQEVQPALEILVGALFLTGICALLWAMGGCFRFIGWLLLFAISSLGGGAVLVPWINRRRGFGGFGGGGNGGDDGPPSAPTPSAPTSDEGVAGGAEPMGTRGGAMPQTFGGDVAEARSPEVVEHDLAAPIDYMTAEEINATAEQAPTARRGGKRSSGVKAEETAASGEGAAEAGRGREPVEQDLAAPIDYVTAQEVNTGETIAEGDDFLQIKGVGPTYARRLKDAGFATFADLAAASPEDVGAAIGWPVDRVRRSEIIDQAKVLAQR